MLESRATKVIGKVTKEAICSGEIFFGFPFARFDPQVPREHMRPVVGTWTIKQSTIRFPIEPSNIERPVGKKDESSFIRPTACEQRVANHVGIEPRRGLHHARIASCNLLMAQRRVEVIGDARPEPVEIGIDEKPVSAGLDAGERHRKQIG